MKYADHQQIQSNHDKAYWNSLKTPFELEFYHQGIHFDAPVKISGVTATAVERIEYSPDYSTFGDVQHGEGTMKDLGFVGLKVSHPTNSRDRNDEIVSMLGANYFRMIGTGQVYGLFAHGLIIDTALSSGEEFPHFREFWIKRPKPTDERLTVYTLLGSPRTTGTYRSVVMPERDTVVDVQSKIYLRNKVGKLGIALLTSMPLLGPNQPPSVNNYCPELHDSNGLLIHADDGEWIWRPLNSPKHLAVSNFSMENPQGFGLLQRGRDLSRFEGPDGRYDLRPSVWVTPKGEWSKGSIELVEIPTNDETNDNIVVYRALDQLPEPGKEMNFKYTITFSRDEDKLHAPDNAWVQQTRCSTGGVKQSNLVHQLGGTIAFVVDSTGAKVKKLPGDTPVTAQTSIGGNGEVVESTIRYNPVTKGWCLVMCMKMKGTKKAIEMRIALMNADRTSSETRSYQLLINEQDNRVH